MMNKYLDESDETNWVICHNGRFDAIMSMSCILQDWWPKSEAEKKHIDAIVARMGKYLEFLDEE